MKPETLTHEQALAFIAQHRLWRLARKTKPVLVRPLTPAEVGKEFQTADHVAEVAREGYWLCVGIAGEPWFQAPEKVRAKYEHVGNERKKFDFDNEEREYQVYRPKAGVQHWTAQIESPHIAGFYIKPGYDPERPLYAPSGGYVVREYVEDPYGDLPEDVWLVQQGLFESTYEVVTKQAIAR